MDLDRPLEEQGPFDLIIQKITDYMAAATEGDEEAIKTLKGVEVMYFTLSLSKQPVLLHNFAFQFKCASIAKASLFLLAIELTFNQ